MRLIIAFLIFPLIHSYSQEENVLPDLLEDIGSEYQDAYEEVYEGLSYLLDDPVDLNLAGEEEFKKLLVLNDFQIYALIEYRKAYGLIYSLNELKTIPGFTDQIIRKISPYICISEPAKNNAGSGNMHIRQKLTLKYSKDLNQSQGFIKDSTSSVVTFPGMNRSANARYELKYGTKAMLGFTMDEDPGESFKTSGSFKPDFISGFLEIRPGGIIKQVNSGDFRASYGMGLVLGGFRSGKGSNVIIKPALTGIRKYSSISESNMFRGVAVKMGKQRFNLDLFYSSDKLDANIYSDSVRYFKSLLSTGLHRTESELFNKDKVTNTAIGSHLGVNTRVFNSGITFFGQKYNIDYLLSSNAFIKTRMPKNEYLLNLGYDFKFNFKKGLLSGELSSDNEGRIAFISCIITELHPLIHYCFLLRTYPPLYFSSRSNGFGEKSGTRNERGYYTGLEMFPLKKLKVDIFSDHYCSMFPDGTSTGPKKGNEYFINCSLFLKGIDLSTRFRFEREQIKDINSDPGISEMILSRKLNSRFEFTGNISSAFKVKSRTEISLYNEEKGLWTKGYFCSNDLKLENRSQSLKIWFRYAIFDIPCWDNRIYAYENDISSGFSVPAFVSRGTRSIFLINCKLTRWTKLSFRYSLTSYTGNRIVGSGLDRREGKNFADFAIQVIGQL